MGNIRKHILISGMVQGVFFRSDTKEMALSLGVTGWVKNCWDGRVEAVLEGEKTSVDSLVEWCRKGPSSAHVSKVDVTEEKYTGKFDTFDIAY